MILTTRASPVYEAEEQLLPAAVLGDEHQVARRDVRFVQSHDPFMMKRLEDVVLLKHILFAVCLIRDNLGHEEVARGVLSALADHTEPTPVCDEEEVNISLCKCLMSIEFNSFKTSSLESYKQLTAPVSFCSSSLTILLFYFTQIWS